MNLTIFIRVAPRYPRWGVRVEHPTEGWLVVLESPFLRIAFAGKRDRSRAA